MGREDKDVGGSGDGEVGGEELGGDEEEAYERGSWIEVDLITCVFETNRVGRSLIQATVCDHLSIPAMASDMYTTDVMIYEKWMTRCCIDSVAVVTTEEGGEEGGRWPALTKALRPLETNIVIRSNGESKWWVVRENAKNSV